MTPTQKAILFTAGLMTSTAAIPCTDGWGCTPSNPTPNPTSVTQPVTGIAAPSASAAAAAAASASAQAALTAQQGNQTQTQGPQIQTQGPQIQTQGSQTASQQLVNGSLQINGDKYEAARIPVASANPGVAIAAGLCGFAGGVGGQGITFGLSLNVSGQSESCRTYFMMMANGLSDAATVYGMKKIEGFAEAMNGAADVEEAVAGNPALAGSKYSKFRAIKVQPMQAQ